MSKTKPIKIELAEGFELDVFKHLIEVGLGILGIRSSGKSYTAGKIAEGLAENGVPFIVLDLMGEYKTLREKYPVLIACIGDPGYGDIKGLTPQGADPLARYVIGSGLSLILDLSDGKMREAFEVLATFLESLYEAERKAKRPYVLVMDEAHRITPEKGVFKLESLKEPQKKIQYWVYEIGATGRHFGLGFVAVARRAAEISKMTLGNCEVKILHQVVDSTDLERYASYGIPRDQFDEIRRLDHGEAFVVGLAEPRKIKIKERRYPRSRDAPSGIGGNAGPGRSYQRARKTDQEVAQAP